MNGASRVVVTGWVPEPALQAIRGAGHEVQAWDGATAVPREDLLRLVRGAHGLVTLVTERVDTELLDAAGDQLAVVANVAVGYDNLDLEACRRRGVVATNTPGVLTDAVADLAMALILMTTRRLGEAERLIRAGQDWQWGMRFMLGRGLRGRTLGVVGLGGIGRATARRARAFGMSVAYTGRRDAPADVVHELDARRLPLDQLLEESDVLTLHLPHTAQTHHLIGAEQLRRLGPTAYLVNTGRGPVVDESALVEALEEGRIAGAGLDVFEHEPAVHPALLGRDDVVLLPHVGSATLETRTAMAALAADNVVAVLAGREPPTPIG
jgi:glyoxylate reductase